MPKDESSGQEPVKVVFNQVGRQVKKRTAKEASCWIWSPGNLQLLKEGEKLVAATGKGGAPPVKQVDYVRAAWVPGSEKVYIFLSNEKDPDAVTVNRSGKRVTANLSDDFIAWGIALAVNTKSRFRMVPATPQDPVYPAVVVDVGAPVETENTGKKKGKDEQAQGQAQAAQGRSRNGQTRAQNQTVPAQSPTAPAQSQAAAQHQPAQAQPQTPAQNGQAQPGNKGS
jgi:hypothetical protein